MGLLKSVGKLVGIDYDAATKAAKDQAAATRQAAALQAASDNAQAQAAQNQIEAETNQRLATQAANDLLNKPIQSADVDLATAAGDSTQDGEDDDLLSRRRSVRQSYQTPSANAGLLI